MRLFRVVLLPAEGLPTRPIRGSRGIMKRNIRIWKTEVDAVVLDVAIN